ncbi:NAD(P)H:quinone oxidoreductase [Aquella oligotrophica]|uniref:NAD(P)H:quinone oxidoreductase n=2 Tax=Aquella oligotrophica TaxID=2067065 RepID=A0A2I7N618_9NEIS|nr:NAD(P)H:quinone oxidoreductase [Aquella oligotrophica]
MKFTSNTMRIFGFMLICFYLTKGFAMDISNKEVLILIDSSGGNTYKLAESIKAGVVNKGLHAVIKKVPNKVDPQNDLNKIPIATADELVKYRGIAFGAPIYFGNISTNMMDFMAQTLDIWKKQELSNVPATVFMSGCSGSGSETAIISFWNILASHGMTIVTLGNPSLPDINKAIPQGNTPYGVTTRSCMPGDVRPSKDELKYAYFQGQKLASAINSTKIQQDPLAAPAKKEITTSKVEERLNKLGIVLPITPKPVGNYVPYKIVGNLVYINQVALNNGKILYPGMIESTVTEKQAKLATQQTILNILSVLKVAANGNLDNVKQVVQLSGTFNTQPNYTNHAGLMNEASNLLVSIFGDKGIHTRATFGANSLPLNSPVEIQAIFEINS